MKKYLAVALAIGITIGPASALDVGVGGKVGGIGVSAGLGLGSQGATVGAGVSADGVGGANVGASTGGRSLGLSAGGTVGGTSIGASTSVGDPSAPSGSTGVAAGDTAANGSAASTQNPAAVAAAPSMAKSAARRISLPPTLRPSRSANGSGLGRVAKGYPFAPLSPLKAIPGTPANIVRACRAAITAAARPLGAMHVYVASAGPLRRRGIGLNAPIEVRIDYDRLGGIEVKQAKVGCRLNAKGTVTKVT
ncbi:hypothetical protein NKI36_17060 [Mesorhizobium caraganae]|uniref:Helicase n=1 Tax=Mesorhizobium caraganae TaxID=483206 RepID=A0ABV1Z185_9HYPH